MSHEPLYQFQPDIPDTIVTVGAAGSNANYETIYQAVSAGKYSMSLISSIDEGDNRVVLTDGVLIHINLSGYNITYSELGGVDIGRDARVDFAGPGGIYVNKEEGSEIFLIQGTDVQETEMDPPAEHRHVYMENIVLFFNGSLNSFYQVTINAKSTQFLLFTADGTFTDTFGEASCFQSCVFIGLGSMLKFYSGPNAGGTISNCIITGYWYSYERDGNDVGVYFGNMTVLNLNMRLWFASLYMYVNYLDGLVLGNSPSITVVALPGEGARSTYFCNLDLYNSSYQVPNNFGYGTIDISYTDRATVHNCQSYGIINDDSTLSKLSNCRFEMYNGDSTSSLYGDQTHISNCEFSSDDGDDVVIYGSNTRMTNCTVTYGLLAFAGNSANNCISNCSAEMLILTANGQTTVDNCQFSSVLVYDTHNRISNCYISDNLTIDANGSVTGISNCYCNTLSCHINAVNCICTGTTINVGNDPSINFSQYIGNIWLD